MSHSVIGSFATMMPKLEARESLRRAAEIAVGSGVLKPARARRIIREWQRMARTRHHRAGVKAKTADEHRSLLAGIGIPMQIVPKG